MASATSGSSGASMTKFGRYPDKDLDRPRRRGGARRARRRRRDDRTTWTCWARATSLEAASGVGQRLQKQIGQTGIPVLQRRQRVRDRRDRRALRVHGDQVRARPRWASPSGWRRWARPGLLGAVGPAPTSNVFEPSGRYGSVMSVEGRLGTTLMPGVFAQAGMEYAGEHDGVGFEQFAKVAEKNHAALDAEPARAVPEAVLARRGDERRDDGVPEHAADVLPDGRRRRRARAGVGGEARGRSPTTSASGR